MVDYCLKGAKVRQTKKMREENLSCSSFNYRIHSKNKNRHNLSSSYQYLHTTQYGNEDALFIFFSSFPLSTLSKSICTTRLPLFLILNALRLTMMEYLMCFQFNQVSRARREGPRIPNGSKQ